LNSIPGDDDFGDNRNGDPDDHDDPDNEDPDNSDPELGTLMIPNMEFRTIWQTQSPR